MANDLLASAQEKNRGNVAVLFANSFYVPFVALGLDSERSHVCVAQGQQVDVDRIELGRVARSRIALRADSPDQLGHAAGVVLRNAEAQQILVCNLRGGRLVLSAVACVRVLRLSREDDAVVPGRQPNELGAVHLRRQGLHARRDVHQVLKSVIVPVVGRPSLENVATCYGELLLRQRRTSRLDCPHIRLRQPLRNADVHRNLLP